MPPTAALGTDTPCRFLAWDSEHFGFRIGRADLDRLTGEACAAVRAWARQNAIRCIYLCLDDDAETRRLAEREGYRDMGACVTWTRALDDLAVPEEPDVREATVEDIPALRAIAATAFQLSRFYADGRFARDRVNAMYAQWIERSCREPEFASGVVVACRNGAAVGFLSWAHAAGDERAYLTLLAVSAAGRGIGQRLGHAALARIRAQGRRLLTSDTLGANPAIQRVHAKLGFTAVRTRRWYHAWFGGGPDRA